MCKPSAGLHAVVFKELIKLRLHSLEILIVFLKENNFVCIISISFQFLQGTEQQLLGFSLHFQRKKVTFNPGCKIFQYCRQGSLPMSRFWRQFSQPG